RIRRDEGRHNAGGNEPQTHAEANAREGGQPRDGVGGADNGCVDGTHAPAQVAGAHDHGQAYDEVIAKAQGDGHTDDGEGDLDVVTGDEAEGREQERNDPDHGSAGDLAGVDAAQQGADAAFQRARLVDDGERTGGQHDDGDNVRRSREALGNGIENIKQ